MDIDFNVLTRNFLECFENKDASFLIERYSFEERLCIAQDVYGYLSQITVSDNSRSYAEVFEKFIKSSLFSEKEVVENIDNYVDNQGIIEIMLCCGQVDDEFKQQKIIKLDDRGSKSRVICGYKKDENKISDLRFFESKKDDYFIRDIICSFEKDENKEQEMERIYNTNYKFEVLKSLKTDTNKLKYVVDERFTDWWIDGKVLISTLSDDALKIPFLEDYRYRTTVIRSLKDDLKKISYLNETMSDYEKTSIISSLKDDILKLEHLQDVENISNRKSIIESMEDVELAISGALKNNYIDLVENIINHNEMILNLKSINEEVVKIYAEKYNLNYENLLVLTAKYSYEILRNVENENINSLINSNKEDFEKTLKFFDLKAFAMNHHDIENVLNSIVQREFRINQREIMGVFNRFEDRINKKDKENFVFELAKIAEEYDITNILIENNITFKSLVEGVFLDDNKEYLNIVHEITDNYIMKKREKYASKRIPELFSKLNLEKTYGKNITIKKFFELESIDSILKIINYVDKKQLSEGASVFLESNEVLKECIIYKKKSTRFFV